jgi:hypothetical protein
MDTQQRLNFSTDLLRISNWIFLKQDNLVDNFIGICEKKYQLPEKYVYLFELTKKWKQRRYEGADAASTLSRLII